MKVNLKALLFASAATLAMSAVSAPAFADNLPSIGGGDIKTGGVLNDNRADSGKTAAAIQRDRNQINQNTGDIAKAEAAANVAQTSADTANVAAGKAQTAADNAQGDATKALAGVADNANAIKQNSDAITGLSNIATQTTDWDKTVGATAVDKVARNRLDENDSMNQIQNAAIDKNTKDIAKNSDRLDENDSMNALQNKVIDNNSKRLDENDSMNTIQNAAIDKNTKGVKKAQSTADKAQADATAALSGDANDSVARSKAQDAQKDATRALTGQANDEIARDGVAANAQRINEANQNIANAGAAARSYTDQTAAKTLASANAYTDSRYNQLDGKVKKLRARVDSGVAGATAIGTLAFDSLKANSIAGGLSVAKNKVAGAVGYQHNFNESWRARGTLAVSDNYVQGGASVGYSW